MVPLDIMGMQCFNCYGHRSVKAIMTHYFSFKVLLRLRLA